MKDQHTLIDDYVRDILSDEDKASFELEMAKNVVLREEVSFRKTIVRHFKFEEIKQTIEQARIENEQEAETKLETVKATIVEAKTENIKSRQKRMKLYRNLSIAALFFVIIAGGWFWNKFQEDVFLVDIIITEADLKNVAAFNIEEITSLVEKANEAKDNEDFNTVLSITDQLRIKEEYETDEMLQNECYIYFKKGAYKTANRKIEDMRDEARANEMRWEISRLYLKKGEKDYAIDQLKQITSEPYLAKASKKLAKLNP